LFDGYFVALAGKNLGGSLALALTRIAVHHSTIMSSFGVYLWLESALTGVATPTGNYAGALAFDSGLPTPAAGNRFGYTGNA